MIFTQLKLDINNNFYVNTDASDIPMTILGYFFSEINNAANGALFYYNWAFHDGSDIITNNAVKLEKEHGYIYIEDLFPLEKYEKEKFIAHEKQFLQLLTDWQERVCKNKPKEVIIIYENDKFIIKTQS